MIPATSRYLQAEHVFTQAHLYNEFGFPYLEGSAPNLKITTVNRETTFLVSTLAFEPEQAQEYFVRDGEDVQWLSFKFLRDPTQWWQVANTNPQIWYPLDMPMGSYIRIPPSLPTS